MLFARQLSLTMPFVDDDVAGSNGVCKVLGKEHAWDIDDEVRAGIAENMEDYLYMKARAHSFSGATVKDEKA